MELLATFSLFLRTKCPIYLGLILLSFVVALSAQVGDKNTFDKSTTPNSVAYMDSTPVTLYTGTMSDRTYATRVTSTSQPSTFVTTEPDRTMIVSVSPTTISTYDTSGSSLATTTNIAETSTTKGTAPRGLSDIPPPPPTMPTTPGLPSPPPSPSSPSTSRQPSTTSPSPSKTSTTSSAPSQTSTTSSTPSKTSTTSSGPSKTSTTSSAPSTRSSPTSTSSSSSTSSSPSSTSSSPAPKSPPPPPKSPPPPPKSPPPPPTPTATTTTTPTAAANVSNFCNVATEFFYDTKCSNCPMGFLTECPFTNDTMISRHRCTVRGFPFWWCQYTCKKVLWARACCPGFWGDKCDECPGGHEKSCNLHGKCENNGTCTCQEGFTGTACEVCEDANKFGTNCSHDCTCVHGKCNAGVHGDGTCDCDSGYEGDFCDKVIAGCETLDCTANNSSNWRCALVDGAPACICAVGYKLDETRHKCIMTSKCDAPVSPCHRRSSCETVGPGEHRCICEEGYTGDGIACMPIDPCQTNNGGCDKTTDCEYLGPNRSVCHCKAGYESYAPGRGCSLTDMCTTRLCDRNAYCNTTAPLKYSCTCKDGYTGNGRTCFGNILQSLKDLNRSDRRLKKDLELVIYIINKFYLEPLTQHGPFTFFVPNDRAFRAEIRKNKGFSGFLKDKDRVMQIIRQHILIGRYELRELQPFDKFYTLQGNAALLQIRVAKDVFKYKLHGSSPKCKIVRRNVMASNGIIHVVNNLLTIKPEISGNPKSLAMDLIKAEKDYNTFQSLIETVGMQNEFSAPNITVFAPENSAWNALPTGTVAHLLTDRDAREKLKVVLKNHIFPGVIGVTDLIEQKHILSLAKEEVKVSVTRQGQIQLGDKANVTQVNIPCKNGVYHHLQGLLLPPYLTDLLPNKCPINETIRVRGPCRRNACDPYFGVAPCPRLTDHRTTEREHCTARSNVLQEYGPEMSNSSCAAICLRNVQTPECCAGFYGVACLPCPGGFKNPCLGRGQCRGSLRGDGSCVCEDNFAGTACEKCKEKKHFGPNCTEQCTCLYGECDDGPKGTGLCKKESCWMGYTGVNCERKMLVCGRGFIICHAHARCYVDDDGKTSCRCAAGYRMEGEDCVEINYCEEAEEPPCDEQAICTMVGPGAVKCTCNDGWLGDGNYCFADAPCVRHSDCDGNATCKSVEPGQYYCMCNDGFKGDGKNCVLTNKCVVNNGGCHPNATCELLANGTDSFCTGTISTIVMTHPNLTRLAKMLETIEYSNNMLANKYDVLTLLAPSDAAMESFMTAFREKNNASYWMDSENIVWFFTFHTLPRGFKVEQLISTHEIPTLYDGFSLHTAWTEKLLIFAKHSEFATVIDGNIYAINGWVHVIDKVLEPFYPTDSPPDLYDTLAARPEYSLFLQSIKSSGILEDLEEEYGYTSYTAFVPTNEHFVKFHQNFSPDYLKYYIVHDLLYTPVVTPNQSADTVGGKEYKLFFTVEGETVYVNGVKITRPDILFEGGVMHEVDGLISSFRNNCSDMGYEEVLGPCLDCFRRAIEDVCPPGGFSRKRTTWSVQNVSVACKPETTRDPKFSPGCQALCVRPSGLVPRCCAGYFGPHCDPCPGGPDKPCLGRGQCQAGVDGNGTCTCDPRYTGPACERCSDENSVLPFCNFTYRSCAHRNGNCSEYAVCTETNNGVSCRCPLGYVGDGYTCTPLCDKLNNGGCHKQALCEFSSAERAIQCTCKPGYHGDGKWCQHDLDPCGVDNGGCDPERATCVFIPPEHKQDDPAHHSCECHGGYVGNGTLCATDLMDAIARIKQLEYFYNWLQNTPTAVNGTQLLVSRATNSTLFAPLNKDWQSLSLDTLLVVGEMFTLPPTNLHTNTDDEKDDDSDERLWVLTSAGGETINITVNDKEEYFANDVKIVEANIETLNGILHLTEVPISSSYVRVGASAEGDNSNSTVVIACVVVAVVIVLAVVVVILLVKFRHHKGFLSLFRRSQGSESNLSFARLNAQEDDDDSFKLSDAAKYDNPLFNEPDYLSL